MPDIVENFLKNETKPNNSREGEWEEVRQCKAGLILLNFWRLNDFLKKASYKNKNGRSKEKRGKFEEEKEKQKKLERREFVEEKSIFE